MKQYKLPLTVNKGRRKRAAPKRFSPVKVEMIEKNEECLHNLSDSFLYNNHYDKPQGICSALHHVLQLYIWRASLGFPSWEKDRNSYKIHCPDKKGTVWEVKRTICK